MQSRLLATSAVLAALLVTGCGGGTDGEEQPDGSTAAAPDAAGSDVATESEVNPVDVLRMVPDCTIGAGVESGEPDMNGNLYASCEIEDVEFTDGDDRYTTDVGVTARAVPPEAARELGYDDLITPDDSHKVIAGDGFFLVLTASPAAFGTGAVDVEEIAAAVEGQVL
ncbi:hypothetical protein [uncultured Nocardioides sp.]|uniref:hypothetical protein n=1 Tax=uncultured Nocardioides sp. TaxID=198441 RepID=UPI000C4443AA|nr:hypothetical protein [Nocardioides sp.]|tara:strand:+ start:3448 stop:3951 length:504 start_codon:yes stop_codon:yes gene_type:complete